MSIVPVLEPISDELQLVERLLRASLQSEVALVSQVGEHVVAGGGKRLRPAMVLLASALGNKPPAGRFQVAAAIELIHTATLLHDDVVDESSLRRGRSTANSAFGNAAAVLAGDFLYSRAFQMMVSAGHPDVMAIVSDATNTIAEGELLQLMNCGDPDLGETACLDVIRRKTATLFEASARVGSVLVAAEKDVQDALGAYGSHLGTAFQLVDDVLDYSGDADSIGKSLGDDLAEGKVTLPLIRTMQRSTPARAEMVRNAIREGGRERFSDVLDAVMQCGAIEYVRSVARREAETAAEAIAQLPSSKPKGILLELADFAVSRCF
jgi:octaprenyl-diphosphate synthase